MNEFISKNFFVICILAPIVEESIFRYFIFRILGKNNYFSYFISFFTFILVHYHRGENFLLTFFQYLIPNLGFIYIYKKSSWKLLSPILFHALVNLFLIIIVLINPRFSLI